MEFAAAGGPVAQALRGDLLLHARVALRDGHVDEWHVPQPEAPPEAREEEPALAILEDTSIEGGSGVRKLQDVSHIWQQRRCRSLLKDDTAGKF